MYFCDGLVDDIRCQSLRDRVIARNSSFVYNGRSVDVHDAAKQLGPQPPATVKIIRLKQVSNITEVSRPTQWKPGHLTT